MFAAIFEPFLRESPVAVMYRLTLERVLAPARLDELFAAAAVRQRPSELLFSTCVETLASVVAGTRKSVRSVYQRKQEEFAVGIRALYDKLAGVETQVSERLVAATADELAALVERFGPERRTLLAG
jgi:hypothetical protein